MDAEEAGSVKLAEESNKLQETTEAVVKPKQKKHRMTFEEAERLRLEAETKEEKLKNESDKKCKLTENIPEAEEISIEKSISKTSSSTSESVCLASDKTSRMENHSAVAISSLQEVDGAVISKMSGMSVTKVESSKDVIMETVGKG